MKTEQNNNHNNPNPKQNKQNTRLKSNVALYCPAYPPGSLINKVYCPTWAFRVVLVVKNPPANAGDVGDLGSIPGLARFPGGEHGNPLQYSCLENPHGRRNLVGYNP